MATLTLNAYLRNILKEKPLGRVQLWPADDRSFCSGAVFNLPAGRAEELLIASTSILFVLDGAASMTMPRASCSLNAGNLLILPAQTRLQIKLSTQTLLIVFELTSQGQQNLEMMFQSQNAVETELIKQVQRQLKTYGAIWFQTTSAMRSAQLLRQAIDDELRQDAFTSLLVHARLLQSVVLALRSRRFGFQQRIDTDKKPELTAQTLQQFIVARDAQVDLHQAADYFGLNVNYFSSLVKNRTGQSFMAQVDAARMQEARRLLAQPELSIKTIIHRVGYSSKSFFYKKFNDYYHVTPAALRAQLFAQQNIHLN